MSKQKHKKSSKFIIWSVVIVGAIVSVFVLQQSQSENSNSASAEAAKYRFELATDESEQNDELNNESVNRGRLSQRSQKHVSSAVSIDTSQMDSQINTIISQNPDIIFGVSIVDLNTGLTYDYGNEEAMTAASVTKVLTAVDYLKQVELGKKSLETTMANGSSAQENIEQMIVVSDNDAWHVLNDNLGYSQLQDYAHSIGLTSYDYAENKISSSNTAKLLGDLYERKLINESNTQLILSYMERANYRDLIIPAVPMHDTVYHKAGEYLANLNDAAIITNANKTISLSIYTESKSGYDKARVSKLMQQITTPALQTFQLN